MKEYRWTGKNAVGKRIKGRLMAQGPGYARITLQKKGISVLGIKENSVHGSGMFSLFRSHVSEKDLILFSRQLATMLNAGLPLLQSLEFLGSRHGSPGFQGILESVKTSVESGESFTRALKHHPRVFNELYIRMVAAGETAGILDVILGRLAVQMEKMAGLKKKIKGAMLYPVFTLFVAGAVLTLMLIFVIPVFEQMFADMGAALPASTLLVLSMSDFTAEYIWYIMAGILVLVLLARWTYQTKSGKMAGDYIFLKIPLLGSLITRTAVARFTRTASFLLASGVPIMEALHIVSGIPGNAIIEQAILHVQSGLSQGRYLAELLEESGVFPPMVSSMIAAGEATGTLDEMMGKIADFYDDEVDEILGNLTALIEPVMLVFLGIIIGSLVIAMYLPVFTMTGVLI